MTIQLSYIKGGEKIKKVNKNILITTLIFTLFLITISSASATEHNITNSTTGGLNNTVANIANNGDTINLEEGIYTNNVTNIIINKNLTIQGKNPQTTIIDAQQLGRIFNITAGNTLTIINITLINGNATNGGGIYNSGILTMTNCILTNNNGSLGGAIYNNNSAMNVEKSNFINNAASSDGGAIFNINGSNAIISNSNFTNNTSRFGGAIYNAGSNMRINTSIFTNN